MKRFGLIPNIDRDVHLQTTREVISYIHAKGHQALMEALSGSDPFPSPAIPTENVFEAADILIILGGDGTMLDTSRMAAAYQKPMLGINLGHLGYLTDVDKSEYRQAIDLFLAGQYKLERRMLLKGHVTWDNDQETPLPVALNDICISRCRGSKLIDLSLYINDEYIDHYRGDGIIIATPTGSTAYNLSAGGPILKPDSEMIAITPICPHTLYARPFVIASGDTVSIRVHSGCMVSKDGSDIMELYENHCITIQRAEESVSILKTNGLGFYDILRLKMVGEMKR